MKSLSVLIPVYCDDVVSQVALLQGQCMVIDGLEWEIVVADDGSPAERGRVNAAVADMDGCRILWRGRNCGRASTRNFLAREARYDTLLYIDSGLAPSANFIQGYVEQIGKAQVVCGTVGVSSDCVDLSSLRCRNEMRAQRRFTAEQHSMKPYRNFHTGAFMIERRVMLDNPLREDITTYGYEDTLFGKQLAMKNVSIIHIDNPVLFTRFESNSRYLEKTREAIGTLYDHRHELEGYSDLLRLACVLRKCHLLWVAWWTGRCLGGAMERNLCGKRPSLMVFNIYRVCEIAKKNLESF